MEIAFDRKILTGTADEIRIFVSQNWTVEDMINLYSSLQNLYDYYCLRDVILSNTSKGKPTTAKDFIKQELKIEVLTVEGMKITDFIYLKYLLILLSGFLMYPAISNILVVNSKGKQKRIKNNLTSI